MELKINEQQLINYYKKINKKSKSAVQMQASRYAPATPNLSSSISKAKQSALNYKGVLKLIFAYSLLLMIFKRYNAEKRNDDFL